MRRRLQCASSPIRTPRKIPGSRSRKSGRIPGLPKTSPCAASFSTWTRGDCAKSKYSNTSAPPDPRSLFVVHRPHKYLEKKKDGKDMPEATWKPHEKHG